MSRIFIWRTKFAQAAWLLVAPAVLALAWGGLCFPASRVAAQAGEFRLTIMHTSENHGHWEPFTQTISLGGIARRATLVKQIRAESPNSLLLDAGDISQGTLYFVQHRYREGAAFYNALGYDAAAIGNHEFDLGPKTFAENFVANLAFPLVSTNLDFSGEPLLAGKIPAYVVKTIGGEKIGLIGLTTEDVSFNTSMGPTIRLKARLDSTRSAVAELQQQGVNKIIALSHLGYPEDLRLAAAIEGIDVIVSGHTFTLLGDGAKLKALGKPDGPYPTVVQSPGGNPVLIVHAYQWGELLGRLNVTFDANGVPVRWDGEPIVVDNSITPDPGVEALVRQFAEPLTAARQTVIGRLMTELDGQPRSVRTQESALGNLVADAMLAATRADHVQVAIMNGGGIRAGLKAGDITIAAALEVVPFGNRLVQMDLNGAELLAALDNGVSQVSQGGGRFPQVSGLRFAFDASRAVGQRVTGVELGSFATGFQPLDPGGVYRVVVNDFMAGGGDGYDVLTLGSAVRGWDVPLDSILMDYIKARGTIDSHVEGRIVNGRLDPLAVALSGTAQPANLLSVTPARPPSRAATTPPVARVQATASAAPQSASSQPQATAVPAGSRSAVSPLSSLTWLCVVVPLGCVVIWGYRRRLRNSKYR